MYTGGLPGGSTPPYCYNPDTSGHTTDDEEEPPPPPENDGCGTGDYPDPISCIASGAGCQVRWCCEESGSDALYGNCYDGDTCSSQWNNCSIYYEPDFEYVELWCNKPDIEPHECCMCHVQYDQGIHGLACCDTSDLTCQNLESGGYDCSGCLCTLDEGGEDDDDSEDPPPEVGPCDSCNTVYTCEWLEVNSTGEWPCCDSEEGCGENGPLGALCCDHAITAQPEFFTCENLESDFYWNCSGCSLCGDDFISTWERGSNSNPLPIDINPNPNDPQNNWER